MKFFRNHISNSNCKHLNLPVTAQNRAIRQPGCVHILCIEVMRSNNVHKVWLPTYVEHLFPLPPPERVSLLLPREPMAQQIEEVDLVLRNRHFSFCKTVIAHHPASYFHVCRHTLLCRWLHWGIAVHGDCALV